MSDWLDTLVRLRENAERAVIVTIASARGSVPRPPGTKMIVTAAAVHGTIGGGHLEHQAIAIARDQFLSSGHDAGALRRFPLGASLGQCCGGLVNLLFEPLTADGEWVQRLVEARARGREAIVVTATGGEAHTGKLTVTSDEVTGAEAPRSNDAPDANSPLIAAAQEMLAGRDAARLVALEGSTYLLERVTPNDFAIVLFGAGHVGRAIVRTLADLPCRVTWVDSRDDEFPGEVPANVAIECTDAPEEAVDAAPPGAYFLVMTHSHPLDEMLTERILRRGDYAYFGLIGSQTKRRAFEKRLERRGVAPERLATMVCPIGIGGISGKEPAVIAIAVAAQLLQVRASAEIGVRPRISDSSTATPENRGLTPNFAR